MESHPKFSASHETALCLVPPGEQWRSIDGIRFCHDRAYGKWPPHINLVYPFVEPACLDQVRELMETHLLSQWSAKGGSTDAPVICLGSADSFSHRESSTLFLEDVHPGHVEWLQRIRAAVLELIGRGGETSSYRMHLTIGQTEHAVDSDGYRFLLDKVRLTPTASWRPSHLAILRRDLTGNMTHWADVNIVDGTVERTAMTAFYEPGLFERNTCRLQAASSYDRGSGLWTKMMSTEPKPRVRSSMEQLVVASYNVQAEFTWPPSHERYPLLVQNLIERNALADVLVLQEVTDDFLTYLLSDSSIREHYAFVSHPPPTQADADPLPHHLNIVVLSKSHFSWYYLPLGRRFKAACMAIFEGLGLDDGSDGTGSLIIAALHLTRGLTDEAVSAKQGELRRILSHLERNYSTFVWILAGDFNIISSSETLSRARESKAVKTQTLDHLEKLESILTEFGLTDTWMMARLEAGESSDDMKPLAGLHDLFEGEQGATFDPQANISAARSVGGGSNDRPQRYDRILVRALDIVQPSRFNMFGFGTLAREISASDRKTLYASDHWGIRCLLRMRESTLGSTTTGGLLAVPITLKRAPASLSTSQTIGDFLEARSILPTIEDEHVRENAILALRQIVLECGPDRSTEAIRGRAISVLVPVGSFALGVWTKDSDLDCTCVGSTRPDTFFRLVRQTLTKAADSSIRILRTVKASSGTMLELEIYGIKTDLQYCQASHIAETWPGVMKKPPSDPVFSLGFEALSKLKPARDLAYLRRSIPDLVQFRLVSHLVKAWAKERGIYGAKFGYLGGIHITALLVPVCKVLHQASTSDSGRISAVDVLTTFFDHYAQFDWETNVVFDPFFHRDLKYRRISREPLCLLGWHSPALNTASTASRSSVNTIAAEFNRANRLLSESHVSWAQFLDGHHPKENVLSSGAIDFLGAYASFAKINLHYWGQSREDGGRLLGWLESRCVGLLVDIDLKIDGLVARLWPQRFVAGPKQAENPLVEDDQMYQGFYLVGLDWDESRSPQDAQAALSNFHAVLHSFERKILMDEKYFDCKTTWFDVSVVRAAEVNSLRPDVREWGQYADSGDIDDLDDEADDDLGSDEGEETTTRGNQTGHRRRPGGHKVHAPRIQKPEGVGKFRTAMDVLNRLRWDPHMDKSDYLVGYLDRFDGVQEKAVSAWKTDQTDEEFIPQHRIVHFKKRSTGLIAWERSSWTDEIFGSGYKHVPS